MKNLNEKQSRHRKNVNCIFRDRFTFGEFHHLWNQLYKDEELFIQYPESKFIFFKPHTLDFIKVETKCPEKQYNLQTSIFLCKIKKTLSFNKVLYYIRVLVKR